MFIKYILLLLFIFALESCVSRILEKEQDTTNIKDNGFMLIPEINFLFLDDIYLVIIPLIFLIIIYMNNIGKMNLLDYIIILLIIRSFRLLCLMCTIYPPPSKNCVETLKIKNKIIPYYSYIFGGCNETIFSGHTSFMVLILLYTMPYLHFFGKFLVVVYAIFGTIIIISLRSHYTIDVLLAWIITYLVYSVYMCCSVAKYLTN